MLLHLAFLLLCVAQIIHYSRTWIDLTVGIAENRAQSRLRSHLDWKMRGGAF